MDSLTTSAWGGTPDVTGGQTVHMVTTIELSRKIFGIYENSSPGVFGGPESIGQGPGSWGGSGKKLPMHFLAPR